MTLQHGSPLSSRCYLTSFYDQFEAADHRDDRRQSRTWYASDFLENIVDYSHCHPRVLFVITNILLFHDM